MRSIKINDLTIEFDGNAELSIEGDKVTVKAKTAVTNEFHYYHYERQPISIPSVFPQNPTIIWGPSWGGTTSTIRSTAGQNTLG